MRPILKKMLKAVTHVQVLSVFLAFSLMVIFSYSFMGRIERKHLLKDVENAMSNTQIYIEADLMEPETTLGVVSENVRNIVISGASLDEVHLYIRNITEYLISNERHLSYITDIFVFFDNRLLTSGEWIPSDDYVVQERPWYKAAVEANGDVGVTEPYLSLTTNENSLAFARQIFDNEGRPLGIVCLNIKLERIGGYAVNTFVTRDSYGILLDKDFNVIAHPHPGFLGRHLSLMNDGEAILTDLQQKNEIFERKATDYRGQNSVLFVKRLNNGWYLAIIAYSEMYYQSVREIGLILLALGIIMASGLSAILLSIVVGKRKAEEHTQVMFDASPLVANFWDKNFRLIGTNLESIKLFNLSSKKEYIERFHELSPEYQPDGRLSSEKAVEQVRRALEEGYCRFEWLHRRLSGELIPCEITLVRVEYRNDFMICGYTRDLREMKSIMAKMREADECTQVLLDTTPLSCFMIDNKLNVIECNQEMVRLFELKGKQEFIDRAFDFFPEYQPSGERSREKIEKYVNEAFEEGYCRFEWTHQKLDGEPIPTEVTLVRVKFRGGNAVAGYIRDLRELKAMLNEMRRAKAAEDNSKAKSEFLAKMSHEIRTPMNAILGITEIQLQDDALPLTTKEALERIYSSGDLLLGIINDILDLSKIEAGKMELTPVNYDIASLIHDTVKLNVIRYESKPIEFLLNISETIPSHLIGDELRIKQILNNLLSNAFKYTEEGQINFTLSVEPVKDSSNVMLLFIISDTGQGMTSDQILRLGDQYSRFNTEANRVTEGTGLGMNITWNLIKLMDGYMTVDSTPGMGSIFTVRLPQKYDGSAPIGRELAENLMQLNIKNTSKMRNARISQEFMPYGRVLVVDDVETNLYVARGLMAPYGLSIDTALSGFEAVNKIREGNIYDIIFMDHMMPKMDGIEATSLIRSLGYTYPVVALTANALTGQAEMFLKSGFDDFISKPIDTRQLNNSLNKLIRDKKPAEVIEEARRQKESLSESRKSRLAPESQLAEFFVRDAEKALSVLDAICRNNCRRSDDLPSLIINVHAMKSALANISESELAEFANKLEQTARDKKINDILSELPAFLEKLQAVIRKYKPDEETDSEVEPDIEIDLPYLQEKMLVIQKACETLNKKAAKAALTELKQKTWPRSIRDKLSSIAECLLHSEFEKAIAVTRDMASSY